MPTPITLAIGTLQLTGQLNDSPTAAELARLLPLTIQMSRWGDEYYGSLPSKLGIAQASDAREEMAVGELAYWPPGNALCIFFGPTPASEGKEPRAASPVNPVGHIKGDLASLRKLGSRVEVAVKK
jgi:uncharacterized protein